jgi:hypothetical protein
MECGRVRRASLVELRCKWSKVTIGKGMGEGIPLLLMVRMVC